MSTRCLVPVDNSEHTWKAVHYVAENLDSGAAVTLLRVLSDLPAATALDGRSLIPSFKQKFQRFRCSQEAEEFAVKNLMERAKKMLIQAGFSSKNISMKVRKKKNGIARDIAKEARRGRYDTLVMGRRELSRIKKLLNGSVSSNVLKLTANGNSALATFKNGLLKVNLMET